MINKKGPLGAKASGPFVRLIRLLERAVTPDLPAYGRAELPGFRREDFP
jgi:hypothetical protein